MELYDSLKKAKHDQSVLTKDVMSIVSQSEDDIHCSINEIVQHFCQDNQCVKLEDFCESYSDDGYIYNRLFLEKMPVELLNMIFKFVTLHKKSAVVEKLYRNK